MHIFGRKKKRERDDVIRLFSRYGRGRKRVVVVQLETKTNKKTYNLTSDGEAVSFFFCFLLKLQNQTKPHYPLHS